VSSTTHCRFILDSPGGRFQSYQNRNSNAFAGTHPLASVHHGRKDSFGGRNMARWANRSLHSILHRVYKWLIEQPCLALEKTNAPS